MPKTARAEAPEEVQPQVPAAEPAAEKHMSDEDMFAEEVARRASGEGGEPPAEPKDTTPLPPAAVDDPLPSQDPPDPAGAVAPPVEGGEAPEQPDVEEAKPAWYADLNDEAKAAFDAMGSDLSEVREQFTALHGRLAPMQQANERLREQATHAGPRQQPTQPDSSAISGQQPGQQQPGASPTPAVDLGDIPEFAEFMEAFPSQAKAIAALFGRQAQHADDLQTQLGTVSEGLREIQQASFGQNRKQSLNDLVSAHPDWMQVRPSEDFGRWLQTQPASVARMADSQDAQECIWILDRYKQDVWAQRQLDSPPPQPQPADSPAPSSIQTVRDRRSVLRSTPSLEPQGSDVGHPLGGEANMSAEDMWDEEVRRRLRLQRDNR